MSFPAALRKLYINLTCRPKAVPDVMPVLIRGPMRKSRFAEAQIMTVHYEVEARAKIADVSRCHGTTETTFHRWRKKGGGFQVSEARRLCALEEQDRQRRWLVADQALNVQVIEGLPGARR